MSDAEAYAAFRAVRFAESGGEPACPKCGCTGAYEFKARSLFKCRECLVQFSLTSGTIFASRKMAIRDILLAIAIFVNGANGVSALRLSRELRCSYKTAYVLSHKLREVLGTLRAKHKLTGIVEIDGLWMGGHIKPKNLKAGRQDRRAKNNEKRLSIVTMRERRRGGRSYSFVFQGEHESIATVLAHVDVSAQVQTDEGSHWIALEGHFDQPRTVNHSKGYSIDGVHTNWVESFNSRLRRAERGVYHHMAGRHLQQYADEFSWREDHRRVDNGTQFTTVLSAAARRPVSRKWKGYWQRRKPGWVAPVKQQRPASRAARSSR